MQPTSVREVPGSNPGYSTFSDNLIYEVNCLAMKCTMMFNTVHLTKMYHQLNITLQQGGVHPVWICLYYTSNLLTLSEIEPELVNGSDSMCWPAHHAVVAQLAAHPTSVRKVPGSNPGYSTFSDNLIYEVNCLAMKCTMMFNTIHLTKMYHQYYIALQQGGVYPVWICNSLLQTIPIFIVNF